MLGIELPILSVGFGAGARAELAAAVSSAGGFGVLGASGVPPDLLRREVARTRALTDHPFGINIIVAEDPAHPEDDRRFFLDQIRAAADADAGAAVLFWGMWAGESCSVVNDVKPAGEIVRGLAAEAIASASAQPRVA
jgi:NAD(P)H-dependent flavin oxidoreductase YrpB (nitropropane dioxygenase family)